MVHPARMIVSFVYRVLWAAIAAFSFGMLLKRLGPWPALGAWAAIIALCCAASALLLRTTGVGEISWKNRVAGIFLSWGSFVGRGGLMSIATASWAAWVLVAVGMILVMAPGAIGMSVNSGPTAGAANAAFHWRYVLFAAWAVNVSAILYLLKTWVRNFSGSGGSSGKSLWSLMGILLLLLAASIGLHLNGHTRTAAIVAGGPLAVVGLAYGAFFAVLFTFGRKGSWH